MRNCDEEIDELVKDIGILNLKKADKVRELKRVRKERTEIGKPGKKGFKENSPVVLDKIGKVINIGDWVKTTTSGRFLHDEGTVVGYKKWMTFTDVTGVKKTRAPHSLLVTRNVREHPARAKLASGKRKHK